MLSSEWVRSPNYPSPSGAVPFLENNEFFERMCQVASTGLLTYVGIGFDPNDPLGPLPPDRGGQSGPAAQIYHQGGMRHLNQLRQQIEQSRWRRRACPIIAAGLARPDFTGITHAVSSLLVLVVPSSS